jgi:hypothetical protein
MVPAAPPVEKQQKRIPGDYNTSKALIIYPGSRRNECETCSEYWIQENGHEPKICCQRCERHSKLYGFEWPKTKNEEGEEPEVRILDHREINRVRSKKKKWEIELEEVQAGEAAKGKKRKAAAREKKEQGVKSYAGLWAHWTPGFVEQKNTRKSAEGGSSKKKRAVSEPKGASARGKGK